METPIITAARNRKPRRCPHAVQQRPGGGGPKNHPHNYVAEGIKKRAGAALGNRHAARGAADDVDRHARLDELIRQVSALADTVTQAAVIARLERQRLQDLWRGCIVTEDCIFDPGNGVTVSRTGAVHAD